MGSMGHMVRMGTQPACSMGSMGSMRGHMASGAQPASWAAWATWAHGPHRHSSNTVTLHPARIQCQYRDQYLAIGFERRLVTFAAFARPRADVFRIFRCRMLKPRARQPRGKMRPQLAQPPCWQDRCQSASVLATLVWVVPSASGFVRRVIRSRDTVRSSATWQQMCYMLCGAYCCILHAARRTYAYSVLTGSTFANGFDMANHLHSSANN